MALTPNERIIAPYVMKQARKRIREYEEACEQWAREGFRPHYCIHGTNQWTDYDNICGWCEESLTFYEIVKYEIQERASRIDAAFEAVTVMRKARMPQELIDAAMDATIAIINQETGQNND